MGYQGLLNFSSVSIVVLSLFFQTAFLNSELWAAGPRETPVVLAVRASRASVVEIKSVSIDESSIKPIKMGHGSGVIVDPRGYILTNNHVVAESISLNVKIPGFKEEFKAKRLASLDHSDIALIKIDTPNPLPAIKFGSSGELEFGETLIAIGYPLGMGLTVTQGILSARVEELQVSKKVKIPFLLQTDAAINPGNSGGAMINLEGELVGITVAMMGGEAQGIAFGLPIDDVRKQLAEMLRQASPLRSQIGIQARSFEKGVNKSLYVESLNEKIDRQGIHFGDRIISVNGRTIHDEADFEFALIDAKAGDTLTVEIDRDEATKETVQLRLE